MARPRKPDELHEMSGAWEKNPQRRRAAAPKSDKPFGSAPKYFDADERACWRELQANSAAGVLTSGDRWLAELACRSMAKMRRREPMTGAELSILLNALARMGLTPVDRTKLTGPSAEKQEADEYAEFAV